MSGSLLSVYQNLRSFGLTLSQTEIIAQIAPSTNTFTTITNTYVGYAGPLRIFMIGSCSLTGYYWDAASDLAYNGGGEIAYWTYTCLGTETSFTLTQSNIDADTTAALTLTINGGANNGLTLVVGSGRANGNNYGHGGACYSLSATGTLTSATRVNYGGYRYNNGICYYSDATNYAANPEASYGDTARYFTLNGDTSGVQFGGSNVAGLKYRPTSVSAYVSYNATYASNTISHGRTTSGLGGVVLLFGSA